ncbi:3'-flap repair endonuclease Xpf [Sulfuracidifex tepidarius]|uniref:3'-flap repair endonuclease Xpf n=1 Tax=Sulfuracidifex tepidarius TaxID=1294262 RepID=A0A510DWP4_9CREN|nr:3'-flap repair endonuclease Xpf [Sulfuracidifex tepidarius]BBG24410.1 3'-flap repair endonuclease Xpf [Sulfuracidifex tepidarius]
MLRIYVDEREIQSGIPSLLKEKGVMVILQQLTVGDYVVADGVAVERKAAMDLINSIFDKRFFDQIKRLTQTYPTSFLLVEGSLERVKQVTEKWKAINGAVVSSIIDFKLNVIYSASKEETAEILIKIAKKLQEEQLNSRSITIHDKRKLSSLEDFQEYVLESFPNVGNSMAKKIMERFNSIEEVCNASISELEKALGSRKRAEMMYSIIHKKFKKNGDNLGEDNQSKSLFDFM